MYFLRCATPLDVPTIAVLVDDYWHLYSDDLAVKWTADEIMAVVNAGRIQMIDCPLYPVGCVLYEDECPHVAHGLHATLHMLIRPNALRGVMKSGLLAEVLRLGFEHYGVKKLKAEALHIQRGLIRLLEKYHFRAVGRQDMETRRNGRYMDRVLFEMKHKRFKKFYGKNKDSAE